MLQRILAMIFGLVFMILAVLGFMPEFYSNGKFLGLFANSSINNIFHLLVGTLGLMAGVRGSLYPRYFFIIVGAIYALIALLGFFDSTMSFFKFLTTSVYNNWLYLITGLLALYFGIALRRHR